MILALFARGAATPGRLLLALLLVTQGCQSGTDSDLRKGAASPPADTAAPSRGGTHTAGTNTASLGATVPDTYPTVGAALAAAVSGDTVTVAAGSFQEDVLVPPGVSLVGAGHGTLIFGTITLEDGASLEELAVDGSLSAAGATGITATGQATLLGVRVDGFTDGVAFGAQAWGAIERTWIEGASAVGLSAGGPGPVTVSNSLALFCGEAGVRAEGAVTIVNSLLFANGFGSATGAGLDATSAAAASVTNSIVVSNHAGLRCATSCPSSHDIVWGNTTNYALAAGPSASDLLLDPRFSAPAEGDFSLQPDSPAIGAADGAAVPPDDYTGSPREGADIGPYGAPGSAGGAVLQIHLTEVMANPLVESTGEYVELFNAGSEAIDLAGFRIDDGDAEDVLVGWAGGPTLLGPASYAIVLDPDYPGTPYDIPAEALALTTASTASLGSGLSTGDPMTIRDPSGAVVDAWSSPFNPGNGVSVEKEELADGDTPANWKASPCGRSPGAPNCAGAVPDPGSVSLVLSEVMANPLDESTGEFIELYNAGDAGAELAGLQLSDGDASDTLQAWAGGETVVPPGGWAVILDPDYAGQYDPLGAGAVVVTVGNKTLGNGLSTNDSIALLDASGDTVLATWNGPFNPGNGISAERLDLNQDTWAGSACASGSSPGASPCEPASEGPPPTLAINEVMANPLSEDTGEFVELFNFGPDPVDLAGLKLSDGDAEEPIVAGLSGTTVLAPGAYALVLDAEYAGDYALPPDALLVGTPDTTLGSGLATTDPITLRQAGGALVDAFALPFNPGNGISAERVHLVATDPTTNWVASPCGASPGEANCASGAGGEPDPPPPVDQPGADDIAVTEVLANPLDESTGEFVELFNTGSETVDLAGFQLDDGDSIDALVPWQDGPTTLSPGAWAVIVDSGYDGVSHTIPPGTVMLTTGDATLGNGLATSDPITLRAPGGAAVSSMSFPSNPGNGKSLERTSPTAPDAPSSWITSECAAGKSPGGPGCSESTPGGGDGAPGDPCPFGDSDCASGVCLPDPLGGPATCGAEAEPPPAGGCGVEISEIMYDAKVVTDTHGEWVELHNSADEAADLTGWHLRDFGSNDFVFGPTTIPAGGYLVLCRDADPATNGGIPCDGELSNFTLGNTNDTVRLEDDVGTVMDQVSYTNGTPWPSQEAGKSIQLIASCTDNASPLAWTIAQSTFGDGDFGTPGADNGVPTLFTTTEVPDWHDQNLKASLRFAPYDDVEAHLLDLLEGATTQVRLAVYNLRLGSVRDALAGLVAAGVDVHVLLDAKVQGDPLNDMGEQLAALGVPVTLVENQGGFFGLMHVKWGVIDGTTVVTGSANWTTTAVTKNDEVVMTIEDPSLAARYLTEWDELAAGGSAPSATMDPTDPVLSFMGPEDGLDQAALAAIEGATDRVLIAMFEMSHEGLMDALIAKHAAGLSVVVVMDEWHADPADIAYLQAGGINPLLADNAGSAFADMHLKMAVIDGAVTLLGSYNWSPNATTTNDENLVIVADPELSARAEGRYAALLETYAPSFDPATIGLVTGDQQVTLDVPNLQLEPGSTLEVVSTEAGGWFDPPVAFPTGTTTTTLSIPAGTTLEFRYRVVGEGGVTFTETGSRHYFTVPFASGPFTIGDVFRP